MLQQRLQPLSASQATVAALSITPHHKITPSTYSDYIIQEMFKTYTIYDEKYAGQPTDNVTRKLYLFNKCCD